MRIELSAVMSELLTILMELLTTLMELLAVLTILLTMFMNLSTLLPIFSTILLNLIHTEIGNYQQKCCDIFHIFRGGTPSESTRLVENFRYIRRATAMRKIPQ